MRATSLLPLFACVAACGDTDPLETSGEFRVLTYNVAGLPTGIASPARPTDDRMEEISPMLLDYDLVGLQEDFTDTGHERLFAAPTHPIRTWFSTIYSSEQVYGSGLSQLSRIGEQVDLFEEHYTACHGVLEAASDCLASKGFQVLRLSLGGAELDFVNTHHEAGGGVEDETVRTSQVDQVLASLSSRSADRAVIFVGDLNMRWSDPPDAVELQRYADAGLRKSCEEVGCPEPDRIDQIWVRDSDDLRLTISDWAVETRFVDDDGTDLSDHEAIALTIQWERL
jgi:endonuclease/exonuclease/phosphatase family metal-dependent hydrolase